MKRYFFLIFLPLFFTVCTVEAQVLTGQDSVSPMIISTGWADEAVTTGYVTASSVVVLMFVSTVVNEWNAGYVGVPATLMILAAPPLIFAGGRSVSISKEISHPTAKLGWTLYALSVIPTSLALYGFTTDWSSTIPLTITSAIFGTGSIIAMTAYANSRAKTGKEMQKNSYNSLGFGISPLKGGALAAITYQF